MQRMKPVCCLKAPNWWMSAPLTQVSDDRIIRDKMTGDLKRGRSAVASRTASRESPLEAGRGSLLAAVSAAMKKATRAIESEYIVNIINY